MPYPDNFSQHTHPAYSAGAVSSAARRALYAERADIERRQEAITDEAIRLDNRWSEIQNEIVTLEMAE